MKALKPESKMKVQVMGVVLAIIFIVFVAAMSYMAKSESSKTISVCRLKSNVNAGALIYESDLEEYKMYYKEFQNAGLQKMTDGTSRSTIIKWEERGNVIGNRYASSFLYAGANLEWKMVTTEQNKKNSYLYSMDGELLNIQMSTTDFGQMVVPGDKLNIRVSYNDIDYSLPTEEDYLLNLELGYRDQKEGTEVQRTERLFNEVTVLDMLNSKGESIFDIYYSFISQSSATQTALLQQEEWIESVKPQSILLQVTSEEADRFMSIKDKSPEYLMTLLPRTESNAILDSLSAVEKVISRTQNN